MDHEKHICMFCKKETPCDLPPYACPWLNDDEIKSCHKCEEQMILEMEEAERVLESCEVTMFGISASTAEDSESICFACNSLEKTLSEIGNLIHNLPDCLYVIRGEGPIPNPCDCAVCKLKSYYRIKR